MFETDPIAVISAARAATFPPSAQPGVDHKDGGPFIGFTCQR